MKIREKIRRFFTIENKILLPFAFIGVFSILALFAGIYWSHFHQFDWNQFVEAVYTQRYLVLAGIALIIVIVQTAVLVAYNIATPIRELSEICTRVSRQPNLSDTAFPELAEYTGRADEAGQLARAFEMMMVSLKTYTDELTWTKALNESIVEDLPLGIIACNAKKECIFRNSRAEAMLRRDTEKDDQGRTLSEIVDERIRADEILPAPAFLKGPDGQERDLEFGIWQLKSPEGSGEGRLITIDDVTYKKRMEEKAARDEKLAYTGRLAANVAHEAKNPLAGIRAGLQVIEPHILNDRDKLLCGEMIREVDRVTILIENLVDLARKRESEKTVVSLASLLEEIRLLYGKITENKGIRLEIRLPENLCLFADEQDVRQILINLINNSIKAMPDGGVLRISGEKDGQKVRLTVADSGIGMSEEKLVRVLKGEGGGLGVNIVRKLAERNGGETRVTSAEGAGTSWDLIWSGAPAGEETLASAAFAPVGRRKEEHGL